MCNDTDKDQDDNISSPQEKPVPWTKKEMEEAAPLPMPEIEDDDGEEA